MIDFDSVFVGREKERQQLRKLWQAALEGNGGCVVIAGEAGIGKTSLARHVAEEAQQAGARFISVSFENIDKYHPFAPFLRIVEKSQRSSTEVHCSPQVEPSCDQTNPKRSTWELESLYSIQAEHGLTQQHLLSSLLEAAHEKALVIELRDLHLAPLTAWRFIHYLSERLTEHKILLMTTLRQTASSTHDEEVPYNDVLRRMNRQGLVVRIEIERFEEKKIREFLNKLFPRSDFSSRLIPLLHEVADGIPGKLRKCLELAWQQDLIYCQDDIWFDRENLEKETLLKLANNTDDLKASLAVLAGLDEELRTLLHYAALLDGTIDHDLLSAITGMSRVKAIRAFHKLQEQNILLCDNQERYRFKFSAFRSALLEEIPAERQQMMQLELARAMEEMGGAPSGERVCQLAYHFKQAQDDSKAFHYLCKATDYALANLAFVEALEFTNSALGIYEHAPDSTAESDVMQLLIQAAWLNRALGNWDESHRLCSVAEELSADSNDNRTRTQIHIQQGLNFFRRNDWEKARQYLEKSLSQARQLGPFEQAIVHNGLGGLYFELSDYNKSKQHLQAALKMAREVDSRKLMANIINSLGAIENVRGNHMQAVGMYSQSIPLFEALGDRVGLARVYHNIGMTYADEGNWEEANQFYGKSLSVSDVMGLVPLKSLTFLNRAFALAHLQRFDEAREYNIKAHRLVQRLQDDLGLAEYHKIQGVIEREELNWSAAREHFRLAMEKFNAVENELGIAETSCEWARTAQATNEQEEMLRWLKDAIAGYEKLGLTKKADLLRREFRQDEPSPSRSDLPRLVS